MSADRSSELRNVAPLEIGIAVGDLDAALAFYRDTLGLAEISRIPTPPAKAIASGIARGGYTVVRLQMATGERIKLFALDDGQSPGAERATPLSGPGFAFLTLIVADIEAAVARLASAGARIRARTVELRPGVRTALVDDPDGLIVEIVQYDDLTDYRPDLAPAASG